MTPGPLPVRTVADERPKELWELLETDQTASRTLHRMTGPDRPGQSKAGGVRLSVIICSHNRVDDLARGLPPLLAEVADRNDVEVLAVDNSSTDGTADLIDRLSRSSAALRYISEERLGVSFARNTGCATARGEVVAYLDDDAVIEPGWLHGVLETFDDPTVTAMAGRILLAWPGRRPSWLPRELESLYSAFDWGSVRQEVGAPHYPWGANMAARTDQLRAVGGFSTAMGRRGTNLRSNEEEQPFRRIREAGGRIVYNPDAVVTHHVSPSRVRPSWVLRRSWAQGSSDAVTGGAPSSLRSLVGCARPRILRAAGESQVQGALQGAANTIYWLAVIWQVAPWSHGSRRPAGTKLGLG